MPSTPSSSSSQIIPPPCLGRSLPRCTERAHSRSGQNLSGRHCSAPSCRCESPCEAYYGDDLPGDDEEYEDLDDLSRSDVEGDGPWLDYVLASAVSTTTVVLAVVLWVTA